MTVANAIVRMDTVDIVAVRQESEDRQEKETRVFQNSKREVIENDVIFTTSVGIRVDSFRIILS